MGFFSLLFGGKDLSPEEEKKEQQRKQFDQLKYDGVKAMKIGQVDYAVKCFTEALKLKDDLETHDYLSQALLRKGDSQGALQELDILAQAEPDNALIQMRIAQVAYAEGDYKLMAAACQKSLQLQPDVPQTYYLYAQAYKGQQNLIGCIAMLTKAVQLKADYADAYLLRGQTLLGMGETDAADADALWLLDKVGAHEDVLMLKARIEAIRGNTERALKAYDIVTEVNPFAIDAYRERGQLKYNAGDKAGAETDMQKVLELDPQALADVSGEYSAEGIEQRVKQAYSAVNPLGL